MGFATICSVFAAIVAGLVAMALLKEDLASTNIEAEYDFIVVGAGSAGGALAARLSEDGRFSVLLLEAGGEDTKMEIPIPLASASLQRTEIDWKIRTEPNEHSNRGMHGNVSFWPRGKVLGGSSSINYMAWVRGNAKDYEHWADERGMAGWAWEDVAPVFQRMEDVQRDDVDKSVRGVGGPIKITTLERTPLTTAFVKSGPSVGLRINNDYNDGQQEGISYVEANIHNCQRQNTATAYIKPALHRPNFAVLTHASVTRVLINADKHATGVAYVGMHTNGEAEVKARKEVILSAGAVHSPQLLMLSGVGPAKHLEEMGIPVKVDAPAVGQNLQDHFMVGVPYKTSAAGKEGAFDIEKAKSPLSLIEYFALGSGPLCSNGLEGTAHVSSGLRNDIKMPDLQVHFFSGLGLDDDSYKNFNYKKEAVMNGKWETDGFTFLIINTHPKSVGHISLRSKNAADAPVVVPNYLQEDIDVKVMLEGIRMVELMAESDAFQGLHEGLMDGTYANPHPLDSDEYWEHAIRNLAITVYHPVGTCSAGAPGDKNAVVDPRLRVQGVTGLRVADASIMPTLPSGNTNAPSIMIGERAADFILSDY